MITPRTYRSTAIYATSDQCVLTKDVTIRHVGTPDICAVLARGRSASLIGLGSGGRSSRGAAVYTAARDRFKLMNFTSVLACTPVIPGTPQHGVGGGLRKIIQHLVGQEITHDEGMNTD